MFWVRVQERLITYSPEMIFYGGMAIAVYVTNMVTKAVSERHFIKHHLDQKTTDLVRNLKEEVKGLRKENASLKDSNAKLSTMVRGARAALNIFIRSEE
jgi:cytochrome c-type biogenesis protein CcmH/NrfF